MVSAELNIIVYVSKGSRNTLSEMQTTVKTLRKSHSERKRIVSIEKQHSDLYLGPQLLKCDNSTFELGPNCTYNIDYVGIIYLVHVISLREKHS